MRKLLLLAAVAAAPLAASAQTTDLVITGIFDGPLTGGTPKVLELRARVAIADLSIYDIQNYNNGATTATSTTALTGSATAGQYLYVTSDAGTTFQTYFGFAATQTGVNAVNVNGDDAVALRRSGAIVDVFGEIGVDGTGTAWEYLDGWALSNRTTNSSTFTAANWTYSGPNATDGCATNATCASTFSAGTSGTLPVELSAFTAAADNGAAVLRWTTESETNNSGFAIEALRGAAWTELAFVAGRGTTSERMSYERRIDGLGAGTHRFRLVQRDLDGTATVAGAVELAILPESGLTVETRRGLVRVSVREAQAVTVEAFDVTGRRVAVLAEGAFEAGTREFAFGDGLAAGVYVVRASGTGASATATAVVR